MSNLFRKTALDRLSSPEQLDQTMRVTSPAGWVMLTASILLVAMALGWGFFGTVPTKVRGEGILVQKNVLFDIISMGNGQIVELLPDVGQYIHKGEVVAWIHQPAILHRLAEAKRTLGVLRTEEQFTDDLGSSILSARIEHINQTRRSLQESISISEGNIKDLREHLEIHEKLLAEKLISKKVYLDVKSDYNLELKQLYGFQQQLAGLPTSRFKASSERKKEDTDLHMRIIRAEEHVDAIEDELKLASEVVSPKSGLVNEIFKDPGEYVKIGDPFLSIELDSVEDSIYILSYFSPEFGNRVRPDMIMQVAIPAAQREEYGVLLADVVSTSTFPATAEGMNRVLKNQKLVDHLSRFGPPVIVNARLIKDPTTFSGFKWTSTHGAKIKPKAGTMCQVEVTVQEHKPISLVLPFLKRNLLGIGKDD